MEDGYYWDISNRASAIPEIVYVNNEDLADMMGTGEDFYYVKDLTFLSPKLEAPKVGE